MTEDNGNSKLKPSHLLPLRYIQGHDHILLCLDQPCFNLQIRFIHLQLKTEIYGELCPSLIRIWPLRQNFYFPPMYFFYFVLGATLKTKTNPLSTR